MCVQCKGLTGCSKYGCTQTPTNKANVAELLGRAFQKPETRSVTPSTRAVTRRETTNEALAS